MCDVVSTQYAQERALKCPAGRVDTAVWKTKSHE
eukprot:SAG31_NODE_395_length_16265_cov_4.941420_10_plen_34_part_00